MDDYEEHRDRERMQEDEEPGLMTTGIFSPGEPKKPAKGEVTEKKADCSCRSSSRKRRSKKKLRKAVNPFIVFYLKYYFEKPSKKVTEVARAAAKQWCRMSDKEKAMYIKIARTESRRRQRMKGKRRKKC